MTAQQAREHVAARIVVAKRLGYWAEAMGLQEAALGLAPDAYRFRDQAVRADYRRGYEDGLAMLGIAPGVAA